MAKKICKRDLVGIADKVCDTMHSCIPDIVTNEFGDILVPSNAFQIGVQRILNPVWGIVWDTVGRCLLQVEDMYD